MQIISLNNGEYLLIKGAGSPDPDGHSTPEPAPDNAERIKSWGAPGSNVRQRVTDRADAKAAEDKELFMALAGLFWREIPINYLMNSSRYKVVRDHLNRQARKYGRFLDYSEALKLLERRDRENETQ